MRRAARTTGIALSVLLCLVVAGTAALFVMGGGPYLLIYLLNLQEDWQMSAAAVVAWSVALGAIIAAVCAIARGVARRGGTVTGLMLGVAAYPALCIALVALSPESWAELRWLGFEHGMVAVPVAHGVAIAWVLLRPRGSRRPAVAHSAASAATVVSRWRPVA